MSLPISPIAKLVNSISTALAPAQDQATKAAGKIGDALDKANLDSKINDLASGVGSPTNWAGGVGGGFKNGGFGSIGVQGQTALKGAFSQAQSFVGGAASNFAKSVPAVSNLASDVNRIASSFNKLTGGNLAGGIQNLAAGISGIAGQVNNLLSLRRAENLPSGGELFAKQGAATKLDSSPANDWRVRIDLQNWALMGGSPFMELLKVRGGVVWPYVPNITFSSKANYTNIEATHNNYPFLAYKNSQVDDITISGEFSAETQGDAEYWIAVTTFLRSATKMFFGQSANAGNPPVICKLSGYGSNIFNNVPVVIKNFSVDLKDDTNYVLYEKTKTWVPIMSTISVTVAPIYNRTRLRRFNLQSYASGQMVDNQNVGML